jgi:hypothetical protein
VHLARGGTDVYLPCFRETGSVFIHVPKAAGTSVSRALYGINVGHRKAIDYDRISARYFRRYFRFGFVRNPWDRVVSAYEFAHAGGTEFVKPIHDPAYAGDDFASFDRFVAGWLTRVPLETADVVFQPQWTFLCDRDGTLLVDHVGRTERLTDALRPVEAALGVAIEPARLNRTERRLGYADYYTPETRDIVADIYRRDIEMFGYEFAP